MDNKNPLWLPKGSVRALLALSMVATVIYLAVGEKAMPEALVPVVAMVIGWYFAKRE